MKKIMLLFMCIAFSTAYSQTTKSSHTGFKQLEFYTKMMEGSDYWKNMHQYFMKGQQYRYICITCPSFEPESCLLIGDSTLTLITLDKMLYSYVRDNKESKKPTANSKTLNVSKRFIIELCELIDLASLTSDAYQNSRILDGTTTYFLSYSPAYHSSKTRATGSTSGGNEASQLMGLIDQIRDAVDGKTSFSEADLRARIRSQHEHLFTFLPSNFVDRELYDLQRHKTPALQTQVDGRTFSY